MQVGPTGKVVGIEHIEDLVRTSVKNVQADDPELLTSGRIKLVGKGGDADAVVYTKTETPCPVEDGVIQLHWNFA